MGPGPKESGSFPGSSATLRPLQGAGGDSLAAGSSSFQARSEEQQYQGGPGVYLGASRWNRLIRNRADCQESVSMATRHRSHCVGVCLIQLHWPRESSILIPSS